MISSNSKTIGLFSASEILGIEGRLGVKSLLLSAPIKTGKELGMEESYDEGLANHIGPESCGDNGNISSEALLGERAPMNRDVPHAGYWAP